MLRKRVDPGAGIWDNRKQRTRRINEGDANVGNRVQVGAARRDKGCDAVMLALYYSPWTADCQD